MKIKITKFRIDLILLTIGILCYLFISNVDTLISSYGISGLFYTLQVLFLFIIIFVFFRIAASLFFKLNILYKIKYKTNQYNKIIIKIWTLSLFLFLIPFFRKLNTLEHVNIVVTKEEFNKQINDLELKRIVNDEIYLHKKKMKNIRYKYFNDKLFDLKIFNDPILIKTKYKF